MAIGDKIKAALHLSHAGDSPLAIYDVTNIDEEGIGIATRIGGVKPGSTGVVVGGPVKVLKHKLYGYTKVPSLGGPEYTLVFPIKWDYYQQVAWLPNDHMQVIGFEEGR